MLFSIRSYLDAEMLQFVMKGTHDILRMKRGTYVLHFVPESVIASRQANHTLVTQVLSPTLRGTYFNTAVRLG